METRLIPELPAKERIERTVKCDVCGWHTPGVPQQENRALHAEIADKDSTIAHLSAQISEMTAALAQTTDNYNTLLDDAVSMRAELAREGERVAELRQVVNAAIGVRMHGTDFLNGTHAQILWRLVDALLEPKPLAPLSPAPTTKEEEN
jgi:hypothetical protein